MYSDFKGLDSCKGYYFYNLQNSAFINLHFLQLDFCYQIK